MDDIRIYEDDRLMELHNKFLNLLQEETSFLLEKRYVNDTGRSMRDVAGEMISVYLDTNRHLSERYPDSNTAKKWIAVNIVSADFLREVWL